MIVWLQSAETVNSLLDPKTISVVSCLIAGIGYLFWEKKQLLKQLKEKDDKIEGLQNKIFGIMEERIKEANEKLYDIDKIKQSFREMAGEIQKAFTASKTG